MGFVFSECLQGDHPEAPVVLWGLFSRALLSAGLFVLSVQPQEGTGRALITWAAPLLAGVLWETLAFKQTWANCAYLCWRLSCQGFLPAVVDCSAQC